MAAIQWCTIFSNIHRFSSDGSNLQRPLWWRNRKPASSRLESKRNIRDIWLRKSVSPLLLHHYSTRLCRSGTFLPDRISCPPKSPALSDIADSTRDSSTFPRSRSRSDWSMRSRWWKCRHLERRDWWWSDTLLGRPYRPGAYCSGHRWRRMWPRNCRIPWGYIPRGTSASCTISTCSSCRRRRRRRWRPSGLSPCRCSHSRCIFGRDAYIEIGEAGVEQIYLIEPNYKYDIIESTYIDLELFNDIAVCIVGSIVLVNYFADIYLCALLHHP